MRKFDLSLRSSRSSYFATFRHQLTILSKTDALDEEKWLNMLGTFVKDRSEERRVGKECSCRRALVGEKKNVLHGIAIAKGDTSIIGSTSKIKLRAVADG